jgi:hypothetical protein
MLRIVVSLRKVQNSWCQFNDELDKKVYEYDLRFCSLHDLVQIAPNDEDYDGKH